MTACTFPPKARCFPEYQEWIVVPFTLVVVSAQRLVRNTLPSTITCDQPCSATCCSASCRSGACRRGGGQAAVGGLWPMVWSHSRSQAGAQGQRLGRCRTGARAGRASRAGTLISCRRRVAPRARVWGRPARVAAAWSRLWAIAAHSAQAELAPKRPDG